MMSREDLDAYNSLCAKLDVLISAGLGSCVEADALRDEMDAPWYAMTEEEREKVMDPKPFVIGDIVTWADEDGAQHRGVIYGIAADMTPRSENEGRRKLHIRGVDSVGYANVPAERCAIAPREDD